MNSLIGNFTGMDGRIGRQAWWIGVVILIVAALILNWILGLIMGTGMPTLDQLQDPNWLQGYIQRAGWQSVIVSLITAYPYIALSVKRRHDRNNNGYDAIGLIVLGILYSLLQALGVLSPSNMVGTIVGVVFAVYAIYMLVQLGFLKGTVGPNDYGPDPLGG